MSEAAPGSLSEFRHMSTQIDLIVNLLQQPANLEAETPRTGNLPHDAPLDVGETVLPVAADAMSSLPEPDRIRKIIRQRQLRAKFFDASLFADPAWDMLLDLAAATRENVNVSTSSLCIAANVPATTALRWISLMSNAGLLEKVEDTTDRRRIFVVLSKKAIDALDRYFKVAFRSE